MNLESGDARAEQVERETVASRIRERMGDYSPAERKVARTLLAAYPVAGFETVAGLAELAGVSGATVVRFSTRLGFGGFPDLQRALREELELRSASPAALYARTTGERSAPLGDLAQLGEGPASDIQATFAGLSQHDFDTTIEALANPKRRIWLTGGRYSTYLAEYLASSLEQLRPGARMVPQMASVRAATMIDLDAKDVIIAFDFRRYEERTRQVVQHAKNRKATIILITDAWVSPCAGDADAVLTSLSVERGAFDSVVPVMALIEAIFTATMDRIGPAARERMEAIEQSAQEHRLI